VPVKQAQKRRSQDMFGGYAIDGVFDEMFAAPREPRPHYTHVADRLRALSPAEFSARRRIADVSFRNQGITFTVYGDQRGVEKIFPFDLVPRIIPAEEWRRVSTTAQSLAAPSEQHQDLLPLVRGVDVEQVGG
jgi:uncharacterized circularly permuted ATP-grasp superfamily protein